MEIEIEFEKRIWTYQIDDRDLREQLIHIIQKDTRFTLDDAINVFNNILRNNDLVIDYAKKHLKELEEALYPKIYDEILEKISKGE